MSELVDPVAVPAAPTRSRLNPLAPRGARYFHPRDVAYVVAAPLAHRQQGDQFWVVTSKTWLPGWEVNKRVRLATATHAIEVTVKGIMDFATVTVEGSVPNLRLPHWQAHLQSRKEASSK